MTFVTVKEPEEDSSSDRKKRNAVYFSVARWPDGIIPYVISPKFNENEKRTILLAMQQWENRTCIRFRPKTDDDRHCLEIMESDPGFCASFVGRLYYRPWVCQGMALGAGCVTMSTVLHELGHTIGFYHEHNRPDRDEFISIAENLSPELRSQLTKLFYVDTLGLGYDYASIMHYGSYGGQIQAVEDVVFGNAEELSPLDVLKTNTLYDCPPRNDQPKSVLEIPQGWSLPEGRSSCAKYIRVDESGSFRFPGSSQHQAFQNCTYVLEGPKGYGFDITLPEIGRLENNRWPCNSEYVQLLVDSSLSNYNILRYPGLNQGKICETFDAYDTFSVEQSIVTINYRAGSTPVDLKVNYVLRDVNECQRFHHCHRCVNTIGAYRCECDDGYFHSYASNTCYDVNECSFNNGGCKDKCVNRAGGYECTCDGGLFLQADGKSCGPTKPVVQPVKLVPGTIIPPKNPPPATTTPLPTTTPPPTTPPTTTPRPTTPRPTTPPTTTPRPTTPPTTTPRPTTPPTTTPRPTTPPTTTPRPTTPPTTPTEPAVKACPIPRTPSNMIKSCVTGIRPGQTFAPAAFPDYLSTGRHNCRFLLLASSRNQLRISYNDLPAGAPCSEFSIAVRRGFTATGPIIKEICGDSFKTCDDIIVPLDSNSVVTMTGTPREGVRGFVATLENKS